MKTRIKYDTNDRWVKTDFFLSEEDFEFWKYKQANYRNHLEALETVTPFLRSLGIQRDDLVISIPDGSINISLYLMDQKGFTDYGYSETKGKVHERIERFKQIGAKYLIVNKPEAIQHEDFAPYTQNKIGVYKNIQIFSL